jgi:phosphatidylglycerophosphate synthase
MNNISIPNLLSVSRVGLGIFYAWSVIHSMWYTAVTVLWIAILTDILDGFLARRQGLTSPLGGLLDHGSDAFFVTCGLIALFFHDWAPIALAVIVPLAFAQYVLDSSSLKGHPLRSSQLGRYNGICYFILAGFPIMQHALDITLLPFNLFQWIGWGLVLTTAISMIDRFTTLYRNDV